MPAYSVVSYKQVKKNVIIEQKSWMENLDFEGSDRSSGSAVSVHGEDSKAGTHAALLESLCSSTLRTQAQWRSKNVVHTPRSRDRSDV